MFFFYFFEKIRLLESQDFSYPSFFLFFTNFSLASQSTRSQIQGLASVRKALNL